jgi:DNA-directed RNA polymerase specialized sigma24 family protein
VDKRTYDLLWSQDWDSLGRQLLAYAHHRAWKYSWRHGRSCDPVPGRSIGDRELVAGWTVEDVVQHVIDKTCRGERKWNPDKGELLTWLKWQVNSVMDALARSRPQMYETELVEPQDDETEMLRNRLEHCAALFVGKPDTAGSLSAEEVLLEKEQQRNTKARLDRQCDLIYRAVSGDPELEAVVDAIMDGYGPKRHDIAAAIGITPDEVTNRRKRIRSRLAALGDGEIRGEE